jgi:putative aminopeptidase FrvX
MGTTDWLEKLLAIDSPSGYTEGAIQFVADSFRELGFNTAITRKGACTVSFTDKPLLAIAAHVDTLGLVVTKLKSDGTLAISPLGNPLMPTFEGAYVRVHTRSGTVHTGTLLLNNPSAHANKLAIAGDRTIDTMHVRLDERVGSAEETRALGVAPGDIIAMDPRTSVLPSGYIKSHFLDNKAGCAVLYGLAAAYGGKALPPSSCFSPTTRRLGMVEP